MTQINTKTKVAGAVIVGLIAGVIVKLVFFPAVKDDYFALNERDLQGAPPGLTVLRPTRFPYVQNKGFMFIPSPHRGDQGRWMMGRNLPLRDVIAAAFEADRSVIVLPPEAPAGNFDFLITVADRQDQKLQAAIRKKLSLVAGEESRATPVLAIKVLDASLPGLTVSDASEQPNVEDKDVTIIFRHVPLAAVANGLGQFLTQPLVDETGLTNFYDLTVPWDTQTRRRMRNDATAAAAVDQILSRWGLGLRTDTASLKMLVVKMVK